MDKILRAKLLVPVLVIIVTVLTDVAGVPLEPHTLYTIGAVAISLVVEEGYKEVKEMLKDYKK